MGHCNAPVIITLIDVVSGSGIAGLKVYWTEWQVKELLAELDEIDANIALHASDYIHANEVILTFAKNFSDAVGMFLRQAAKKRNFQVRHPSSPLLRLYWSVSQLVRSPHSCAASIVRQMCAGCILSVEVRFFPVRPAFPWMRQRKGFGASAVLTT